MTAGAVGSAAEDGGVGGGFGARMMAQMGWQRGSGLGRNADGVASALEPALRPEKLGLGASRKGVSEWANVWWEKDPFAEAAKNSGQPRNNLQSGSDSSSDSDTDTGVDPLLAACEGRRCRAAGGGKLERIRRYEQQAASDKTKKAQAGLGGIGKIKKIKEKKTDRKTKKTKAKKDKSITKRNKGKISS